MKKAGVIAASLGTAALLAVGAGSVTMLLTSPGEIVQEANATEVGASAQSAGATSATHNRSTPAARETLRAASGRATSARQVRNDDDDDDDLGDDDWDN